MPIIEAQRPQELKGYGQNVKQQGGVEFNKKKSSLVFNQGQVFNIVLSLMFIQFLLFVITSKNFTLSEQQMDLEKVEEPELKFPTPLDHQKSKRVPEKHLFLLY